MAGAGLYAVYAVADIGASDGTELDRAVASAGQSPAGRPIVAGTASHPGLAINGAIALALVGGWTLLRALTRPAAGEDGHEPAERRRAADDRARARLRFARPVRRSGGQGVPLRGGRLRRLPGAPGDRRRLRRSGRPAGQRSGRARELRQVRGGSAAGTSSITAASDRHLARPAGSSDCGCCGSATRRWSIRRTFSLEGRPIRKVRQSIARVRRHGWRVEVVDGCDVTSAELERELGEVEADWRSRQRRLIGFAMTLGRLAGTDDRDGGVYVLGGTRTAGCAPSSVSPRTATASPST